MGEHDAALYGGVLGGAVMWGGEAAAHGGITPERALGLCLQNSMGVQSTELHYPTLKGFTIFWIQQKDARSLRWGSSVKAKFQFSKV